MANPEFVELVRGPVIESRHRAAIADRQRPGNAEYHQRLMLHTRVLNRDIRLSDSQLLTQPHTSMSYKVQSTPPIVSTVNAGYNFVGSNGHYIDVL